jgi:hypothetical protein
LTAKHALHKRRINERIYESLHARAATGSIGFFCECPSARCFATVRLTAAEYHVGRLRPEWALLADGHGCDHSSTAADTRAASASTR